MKKSDKIIEILARLCAVAVIIFCFWIKYELSLTVSYSGVSSPSMNTDSLAIKSTQFPSNWELSGARACSVEILNR